MAMARQVLPYERGTIVQLGPGTGAITAALLDLGISRDRLYLVEPSADFASVLRLCFPGVRVVEGNALDLREYAERDGIDDIGVIVSGLALSALDWERRAAILGRSFSAMGHAGAFIQFACSHRPPVPPALLADLGLEARTLGFVWLKLPPASVWEFRRATSAKAGVAGGTRPSPRVLGDGAGAGRPRSPFGSGQRGA